MSDRSALVAALKVQLARVEADLRARTDDQDVAWAKQLRAEYEAARVAGRTALSWSVWRDGEVALAGVAWVLGTVFVRFCEDNGLLDRVWIAAPGHRQLEATDAETVFYQADPARNTRDWLRDAFGALTAYPATVGLVDPAHSPVWSAPLGADACADLLAFWRTQHADGSLVWSLADPDWDTRFLGDVYQDLSVFAKKKFALLQTPDFVEEFILDRTLDPALTAVPLAELRLIDPTCGSGHFLLGAFARIHAAWLAEAPGMDARVRVQHVLAAVNGVDINPFAVAIARFRLMLVAMRACGATRLAGAPAFTPQVAVADSLLAGNPQDGTQGELEFADNPYAVLNAHRYAAEDVDEYPGILARRSYHVVVGNPPYITVKDPALNAAYRQRFDTCHRQYALTVPFMELFFDLAIRGIGRPVGWVGQITSNSFMKREFGKKLIEDMLSGVDPLNPVDLLDVIDTSGAYIPGHGTPTVILIGRRQRPARDTVHAALGVRGEPGQPADASRGLVWSEIVGHINDTDDYNGDYVTVTDLPRATLAHHPWSLSGGGAGGVKAHLDSAGTGRLRDRMVSSGRTTHTGADEVYFAPRGTWRRRGIPRESYVSLVEGENLRDFSLALVTEAVFPYDDKLRAALTAPVGKHLKSFRPILRQRREPGGTHEQIGLTWYEWSRWHPERFSVPLGIAFAFVATHNHFVLDRGGKVFNRSAPVIKLPAEANLADHLGLLGVLNSSVACFWLKQVSHNKGEGGGARVDAGYAAMGSETWKDTYEFTGTKLQEFPLPSSLPVGYGHVLDALAQEAADLLPAAVLACVDAGVAPSRGMLDDARRRWLGVRAQMVGWQEELDWHTYRLYGLLDDDLTYTPPPVVPPALDATTDAVPDEPTETVPDEATDADPDSATTAVPDAARDALPDQRTDTDLDGTTSAVSGDATAAAGVGVGAPPAVLADSGAVMLGGSAAVMPSGSVAMLPPVVLGQRAFEIVLARRMAAGAESSEWFARHGSTPITDIPSGWPNDYRDLVQQRIDVIAANPSIKLLERPEFKRRWATEAWESMETTALTGFVLDRLEAPGLWSGPGGPAIRSVAQIADAVRHDGQVQGALSLLFGVDADRVKAIGVLMAGEAVPFLAAYRYKPSGLIKRAEWEAVWESQRREDAGETVDIPVPPKYAPADFVKPTFWKARGKLDVPKERFIAYPGAEQTNDPTPVYGWAGWDHGQTAQALAAMLVERADVAGWEPDRLTPLLAGLAELEPWLVQWHHEYDPEFGASLADDITSLLDDRLNTAGITRNDAYHWRPPTPAARRHKATT